MDTIRIAHRDGSELEVVVPVFEICKLATQLSIEVAKFRDYDPQYGYIHCRDVLLKNFYARVIGSRYREQLPPFTFNEPDAEQMQPQLVDQMNELPDDIKCEILSRVPGAQSLCKGVVRMTPPELKYVATIPFACAQWAMTHRSSYTRTVLERAFEFIGPEIYLLERYANAEETTLIRAETRLHNAIDEDSIIMSVTQPEVPPPVGLLSIPFDDYFIDRFDRLRRVIPMPAVAQSFNPIPGSKMRIRVNITHVELMDQQNRVFSIDDIYDLYKIFTMMPDQWKVLFSGYDSTNDNKIYKEVRSLAIEHPTLESLVQHATLVSDLSNISLR